MDVHEVITESKKILGDWGSAWTEWNSGIANAVFCVGIRKPLDKLGNNHTYEVIGRGNSWDKALAEAAANQLAKESQKMGLYQ
jgi:hypothetical protein